MRIHNPVEIIDCQVGLQRIRSGGSTGPENQGFLGLHQRIDQPFIGFDSNPCFRNYLLLVIRDGGALEFGAQGAGRIFKTPAAQGFADQAEGHDSFAAGSAGQPGVGVGGGERHVRTDVEKSAFALIPQSVHRFELAGVFDRREPGFQKIGTEADQNIGILQSIRRQPLDVENGLIGRLE